MYTMKKETTKKKQEKINKNKLKYISRFSLCHTQQRYYKPKPLVSCYCLLTCRLQHLDYISIISSGTFSYMLVQHVCQYAHCEPLCLLFILGVMKERITQIPPSLLAVMYMVEVPLNSLRSWYNTGVTLILVPLYTLIISSVVPFDIFELHIYFYEIIPQL